MGGEVHGGESVRRRRAGHGAVREQDAHDGFVAVLGGAVERGVAVPAGGIDIGPLGDELPDQLNPAGGGRPEERAVAVAEP